MSAEITPGRKNSARPRGYLEGYKPSSETRRLLEHVDAVLDDYRDHLPLSVRQIYYRLVGAYGYSKEEAFYKRLCHHLVQARRGRRIPFDSIRDDGVVVIEAGHYTDEDAFHKCVAIMARDYRRDKLARQPYHIEVWTEAAGMMPQLARIANKYSINVYSCSGFDSLPAKRMIVDRLVEVAKPGVILHLGDCDPSGESVFDAVSEDVAAFLHEDRRDARQTVRFRRVALTRDQVVEYDLPTEAAKITDSRTKRWAKIHGTDQTAQLEALPPDVIAKLLNETIVSELDMSQFEDDVLEEKFERRRLLALPGPT